ncbi:MAG TPA: LPS assembly lipoprotein LptE [Opitutus sp.]|nr:LPS assembly lipoprotein LptE [Opitutus sp.]
MTRCLPSPGLLLLLVALFSLTGCANYQLGTEGRLTFTTLYIEPVENQTLLPQARTIVSTHIREAFEQDGRVSLASSPETADATLHVVLRDYHRDVTSVRESDTALARKLTLTLAADCTLHDRRTGQTLFANRTLTSQRDAFTDGGQLQSEYQTLPLLAQSLAAKVTHAVLDVW